MLVRLLEGISFGTVPRLAVTVYLRHMVAARAIYFPHGRQAPLQRRPWMGQFRLLLKILHRHVFRISTRCCLALRLVNANTQPALATSFGSSRHFDQPCSGVHGIIPMDLNNCPLCLCGQLSMQLTVRKEGPNMGRMFFKCSKPQGEQCHYFQWADQPLRVAELGATGGGPSPPIPGPPCTCGHSAAYGA